MKRPWKLLKGHDACFDTGLGTLGSPGCARHSGRPETESHSCFQSSQDEEAIVKLVLDVFGENSKVQGILARLGQALDGRRKYDDQARILWARHYLAELREVFSQVDRRGRPGARRKR